MEKQPFFRAGLGSIGLTYYCEEIYKVEQGLTFCVQG